MQKRTTDDGPHWPDFVIPGLLLAILLLAALLCHGCAAPVVDAPDGVAAPDSYLPPDTGPLESTHSDVRGVDALLLERPTLPTCAVQPAGVYGACPSGLRPPAACGRCADGNGNPLPPPACAWAPLAVVCVQTCAECP